MKGTENTMDNMNIRYNNKGETIGKIILYLIMGITMAVYLYPLLWLLINSLKTNPEIALKPWDLPEKIMWSNYTRAWTVGKISKYMLNSVIVTTVSLIFAVMLSAMAAYGIKRMRWKLSGFVLILFLTGTMIPIHTTLIPLFINFSKMGLTNTYFAMILPYITFAFPTTIFILSGFFGTIPREVEEAAILDGCSLWRVFIWIILPISKPAIITVCIFNFIAIWGELLVPLIFISNPDLMTLPIGLTNFVGMYSTDYAPLLAGIFLTILPSIIVYSIFNSQIAAGVTAGALKG